MNVPGLQYPNIRQHLHPAVDDAIRSVFDNLFYLRGQLSSSQSSPTLVQTPQTVANVSPAVISSGGGGGSGSNSTISPVITGTHAARTTTYSSPLPIVGTVYYETDRNACYVVAENLSSILGWFLIAGEMQDTYAHRPTDISTLDNGLCFYATDQTVIYQVQAGIWKYMSGVMSGTLSPNLKPTLVAADAGFIFYASDFDRYYRWGGAGWVNYNGDPQGEIRFFTGDSVPTTGWQICDGSTVTRSTNTGTTAAVTVPDYTTPSYVKAGKTASVGPVAASGISDPTSAGTPAGTISWPAGVPTFAGTALSTHAHELPFQIPSGTVFRTLNPSLSPFSTGTSRAAIGAGTTVADTTSAVVAKSQDVSGGTPSGTISWPAGVPTFAGTALGTHTHGPGTLELQRTQLIAYYRL